MPFTHYENGSVTFPSGNAPKPTQFQVYYKSTLMHTQVRMTISSHIICIHLTCHLFIILTPLNWLRICNEFGSIQKQTVAEEWSFFFIWFCTNQLLKSSLKQCHSWDVIVLLLRSQFEYILPDWPSKPYVHLKNIPTTISSDSCISCIKLSPCWLAVPSVNNGHVSIKPSGG